MQSNARLQHLKPHLLILGIFVLLSFVFCYPVLQGNKLLPHDTYSYLGMSKEARDYYQATGENALWANNMFSGMPQTMVYVHSDKHLLQKVSYLLQGHTEGEPHNPAIFFLLAMVGFYVLMAAMKVPKWLGAIGAIAFAFSSYNPIIIAAGHATKMLDIAFLPGVMAGIIWAYKGRYWLGAIVTGVFLSFYINEAHYQIIFYSLFVVAAMIIANFITAIKNGRLKQFFIASAILAGVAALAAGTNATRLMMVPEYNKHSMRGGASELTNPEKQKDGGLDKSYAFSWSNGIEETLLIMVPNLFGGTMEGALYWGAQQEDGVGTPIYFGAIICFLFVLATLVIRSKQKWWIVAVAAFFIMISWGKNFPALNYFLFDNFPLFNKFRSPNMAMSIASVLFPLLAMWGLKEFFSDQYSAEERWKKLKTSLMITGGLLLVILIAAQTMMSYKGAIDSQIFGNNMAKLDEVRDERKSVATSDALRALFFVLLSGGVLYAFIKGMLKKEVAIAGLGILVILDILPVANRYLNSEDYIDEMTYEAYFTPRPADAQILKDPTPYYRVFDISTRTNVGQSRNVFNDASSSLFHKNIGGYHPAKLEIYQDLIERQIGKLNSAVLNMLNTRYFIQDGPSGQAVASAPNPQACGNAWFVSEIKWVKNADEEMAALNAPSLMNMADTSQGNFQPTHTAIMRDVFKNDLKFSNFGKDDAAGITLTKYSPRRLSYESKNTQNGLAVFSDVWYPDGWTATIDGKEAKILRVNYALRALEIPAGNHKIEFEFNSTAFDKGESISLIANLIMIVIIGLGIYFIYKKGSNGEDSTLRKS
jgi:hypothetical protein